MSLLSRLAVQAARAYGVLSSKAGVSASYLVVAGGGSGGFVTANGGGTGGGGAGGYLTSTATLSTLTTYTITVGAGGASASPGANGSKFSGRYLWAQPGSTSCQTAFLENRLLQRLARWAARSGGWWPSPPPLSRCQPSIGRRPG